MGIRDRDTIMKVSNILNITFLFFRMSPTPTESGDVCWLERPSGYGSDPTGLKKEPLARIELATYALPRRRYTSKPQWQ